MNRETEQKSALHKQKWEKDVGHEYTLKDCENLEPTSQKALVNTTHRLIYDWYILIYFTVCIIPHRGYTRSDPWFHSDSGDPIPIFGNNICGNNIYKQVRNFPKTNSNGSPNIHIERHVYDQRDWLWWKETDSSKKKVKQTCTFNKTIVESFTFTLYIY